METVCEILQSSCIGQSPDGGRVFISAHFTIDGSAMHRGGASALGNLMPENLLKKNLAGAAQFLNSYRIWIRHCSIEKKENLICRAGRRYIVAANG
jgi:hypothetical protein